MSGVVHVTVSGLTGSGKSAVMGEIEIALRAVGLTVEHDAAFQTEKNMTHADWQEALDLYQPTVILNEVNVSRATPADQTDGAGLREADDFPMDGHELSQMAWLCRAAIERFPNWIDSGDLVTAHAHASVLTADLPEALTGNPSLHVSENGGSEEGDAALIMSAEDAPAWAEGIVTDGERVAIAQKAEADYGGTYWSVETGDGAIQWEPTHFIPLSVLSAPTARAGDVSGQTEVGAQAVPDGEAGQ